MGSIDVSLKHTLAAFPQDWAEFLGVPKGASVRVVDRALIIVSAATAVARTPRP